MVVPARRIRQYWRVTRVPVQGREMKGRPDPRSASRFYLVSVTSFFCFKS